MSELDSLFNRIESVLSKYTCDPDISNEIEGEFDNVDIEELFYEILKDKFEKCRKENPQMDRNVVYSRICKEIISIEFPVD